MGPYKYLMIFMCVIEMGYSLIDVLIKPEVICIGTFWIVGTNSKTTSVPLWLAYPLVLLWGASYGIAVAGFGVHFIFRYYMIIGNRKWVTGFLPLCFWFGLLILSGAVYAFIIHVFFNFDEVLRVLLRQNIESLNGVGFDEMVYYGFSLYGIPPSSQINWMSIHGMTVLGGIVTLSLIAMIYFAVKAYLAIQKWSSLSENLCSLSKALQTQLFYSLVVQTIIPMILIHIPTTFICINPFFNAGNEFFGGWIMVTISLFPAIDPLPSMIIVRPYRQAIRMFWGASYGVFVAAFGVQFLFRYLLVIGNQKWVSDPVHIFLWFGILIASGIIYAFTIHIFFRFDDVLEVLVSQNIESLYNIPFSEMVYYGFSVYKTPPSLEIHWTKMEGVFVMGSILTLSFVTMVYFALKAYWAIQKWSSSSNNLSHLSQSLQAQLFYSLVVQTVIPTILILIPTSFVSIAPFFGAGKEIFGRITMMAIAVFPAIDALPSIIIIRPYRQAIGSYVTMLKPTPTPKQKVSNCTNLPIT